MPFDLHDLKPSERDRAYVLVHLMMPEVDLERWRAFLADMEAAWAAGARRGITVATLGEDCLVGLYSWSTQPDLECEKVLAVDHFIAAGALDLSPLFDAMIADIEARAHLHDCGAMQISLPNLVTNARQERLLRDRFAGKGFVAADQKLRRACDTAPLTSESGGAPGTKAPDALH